MRLRFWIYPVCVIALMSCSENKRGDEGADMPEGDELATSVGLASENPFSRVS